jgi:glycosyltransferase involved in cell wall biosynthesis
MSARTLVSIIVPAFNAAAFLRESLDSLVAQTHAPLEILVMDDASTDQTGEISASYGGNVRHVRQPRNRGIYDNVNDGIELARGELIATYHADDIYLPTMVEAQVTYLTAHPQVGAVFCADIFVDAQGNEYGRMVLPREARGEQPLDYRRVLDVLLRYKNRFLVCPTAMVRAAVHREVGKYDQQRYRNTADLEMWLRIARRYPIAVLESHLMKYRHFHGNSSQRYHHLRTAPENFFLIMDEYLTAGGRELASPEALVSYEAHRSEDRLMAAISHYIKGELASGRRTLREVQTPAIARTRQVQRWRLLILTVGMWFVLRLPRVEALARAMHSRWHVKRPPRRHAPARDATAASPGHVA